MRSRALEAPTAQPRFSRPPALSSTALDGGTVLLPGYSSSPLLTLFPRLHT